MFKEVWKDIPGYEGLYQVSDYGRVISLSYNKTGRKSLRTLRLDKAGYIVVTLHKSGVSRTMKVHRLVAIAFIPNPLHLPQVNHRDENKANNHVDNLEWCTSSYNNSYGNRPRKVLDAYKKRNRSIAERPVIMIDNDGTIIAEYHSISEAARNVGVRRESLRDAVLGRSKTCIGYFWKYKL